MSAIEHFSYLAQETHGPGQHGPLLIILVLIAVVAGLVYGLIRLVSKRRARRTDPDRGPQGDRAPRP